MFQIPISLIDIYFAGFERKSKEVLVKRRLGPIFRSLQNVSKSYEDPLGTLIILFETLQSDVEKVQHPMFWVVSAWDTLVKPLQVLGFFLYPLKTSDNQTFSYIISQCFGQLQGLRQTDLCHVTGISLYSLKTL